MATDNVLEIKNLHTYFYTDGGVIKAVDGVDVELRRGATLGIVGESGSGKSVTSLSVMGLLTGTKGKTTTTYMIKKVLEMAGKKVGLIGTIGAMIGEEHLPSKNTTPESYELHRMFAAMVEAGCEYVVMEVSSQGLKLDRTAGILFDYGIFTNLSPDHIGPAEHASFEEYMECKSLLFRQCRIGIVNADDEHSDCNIMLQHIIR